MECVLCVGEKFKKLCVINNLSVDRCLNCDLVATHGKTKISYENYHRDEDYQKFEKMFGNIFLKRFNLIKRYVKGTGKVLDIGCSTGVFLKLFKDKGYEVWGVEPSESGGVAKERGIKISRTTFEKAKLSSNYFDVIILNHTLEHVTNPVNVLKKVKIILKDSGIVLVDVPNFGSLSSKIFGPYWQFLTPEEHLFHFTPETLKKVFEKAGLTVIHEESRSGLFEFADPFVELWDALTTFKKRFFTDLITFPYSLIATWLNMGDSMSIVGTKK